MARSKNVIGLDIGTSSVKLVHLNETKKGIHLLDCAAEALPRDAIVDGQLMNATAVVETVRHLVEKRKLKTKEVAVSISGRSVIIKRSVCRIWTEMPSMIRLSGKLSSTSPSTLMMFI